MALIKVYAGPCGLLLKTMFSHFVFLFVLFYQELCPEKSGLVISDICRILRICSRLDLTVFVPVSRAQGKYYHGPNLMSRKFVVFLRLI